MNSSLALGSSVHQSNSKRVALAAALTAAAAGIHLGVIPEHLEHGAAHVIFFALAAALQGLAVWTLLRRPKRSVVVLAMIVNLGVASIWFASLLPSLSPVIGLQEPQARSTLGMLATSLEGLAIALLVGELSRPSSRSTAVGLPGLVLVGVLGSAIALLAPQGEHSQASPLAAQHHSHIEELEHGVNPAIHPDELPSSVDAQLIDVDHHPEGVALANGYVWVASRTEGTLTSIDPASASASRKLISVGDSPSAVLASDGYLWVASFGEGVVRRIDPQRSRVSTTTPVGRRPVGLTASDGIIWVTNSAEGTVSRIEAATGKLIGTSGRIGYGPTGIAGGGGSIWVVNTLDHAVVRLDPETAQPLAAPIEVPRGAFGATFSGGYLWVASPTSGQVVRIDPANNDIMGLPITLDRSPDLGLGPIWLADGQGTVWVVNNRTKSLIGLDVRTGLVTEPPRYFATARGEFRGISRIAVGADAIWVTDYESGHLARFGL